MPTNVHVGKVLEHIYVFSQLKCGSWCVISFLFSREIFMLTDSDGFLFLVHPQDCLDSLNLSRC